MNDVLSRINLLTKDFEIGVMRDPSDTVDLRYGIRPARAKGGAKRWVIFLSGRTEWVEKYAYLPADLELPDDCGFLTWDHRGQGASGGTRAYIDSYETYARDAAHIVEKIVKDAPYVLMAHSMGGLISLRGAMTGLLKPRSMVLSSPLLGLPDKPVPRPLAKPLSRLMTVARLGFLSTGSGNFTHPTFVRNRLTHHIDLYERMKATPYPCPAATFAWVSATFEAIERSFMPQALANLACPTLIMGGSEESVVDALAFRRFVQEAEKHAPGKVTWRLIPGGRHELFSETQEYYEPAIGAVQLGLSAGWA